MSKKKTKKIYSAAFPLNECNEAVSLKPISEIHKKLLNIEINPDLITYHPIDISYIEEVILLHKEWFPVDYERNYFKEVLNNNYKNFYNIAAFYPIENEENMIAIALCEIQNINRKFKYHSSLEILNKLNKDISFFENIRKIIKMEDFKCTYIMTLGVIDEFRKHNIGSKLIDIIIKKSMEIEFNKCVYLDVITYNEPAIKFYEKNGFINVTTIKCYYNLKNNYYDSYVFCKIYEKNNQNKNNKNFFNEFLIIIENIVGLILYFLTIGFCFRFLRKKYKID